MGIPYGYDVLVVGAGLGSLTAASLLAKRGLKVAVFDRNYMPGGSCGAFRRGDVTFDLGAAMLFGFGETGFNPHRFLVNELEERLEVIRHRAVYRLHYGDREIVFWPDRERFLAELGRAFPGQDVAIRRFYDYIGDLSGKVIAANPVFLSPAEMKKRELIGQLLRHPVRQLKAFSLLSSSAEDLLRAFITDPDLLGFFGKLTSTYCYTTLGETPAIIAATMFVENLTGSSYAIAGSPARLPGMLEKAIERYGGKFFYQTEVTGILFDGRRASGVRLADGREIRARFVVYGGTVWNLYQKLVPPDLVNDRDRRRVAGLVPSFPSVVLHGAVRSEAVPADAFPVEMFVDNTRVIDQDDVTLYLPSLEDGSRAPGGLLSFMLIGPAAGTWPSPLDPEYGSEAYRARKEVETGRLLALVNRRFPAFAANVVYSELGTPATIERYLLKNGGAVAGPKQMIGQELMKRAHARSPWAGLFLCGESTVMGTGTPAVTISGISAADLILRRLGLAEFRAHRQERNYVTVHEKPLPRPKVPAEAPYTASLCRWCEVAACNVSCPAGIDIRGILRRLEMGNYSGARNLLASAEGDTDSCASCTGRPCLSRCLRAEEATSGAGVPPRGRTAPVDENYPCGPVPAAPVDENYPCGPVPIVDNLVWLRSIGGCHDDE